MVWIEVGALNDAMTEPIATDSFPYFGEEHAMLRRTIRRFIADRVLPFGDAWEEQGYRAARDPARDGRARPARHALRAPNTAAPVSIRSPTPCWREELGRSTYGGFAVTVLVHTDMASPHLYHARHAASSSQRWMPDITAGRKITAVAMTEADAGSDLASMRTSARKVAGGYVLNGAKMFITNGVHGDLVVRRRQDRRAPAATGSITMFAVEKGTPGFRVARALKKHGWLSQRHGRAGVRGLLRAGREPARARRAAASTRWSRTCRTSASCSPRRRWARP